MRPRRRSAGAASVLDHRGDGVQHGVVHRLQAGAEQLVAVGEVDVDGGAGDAGLGGDLVHGDLGRAALAEEAAGRIEDLVAPEVADDVLQRVGGAPGHEWCALLARRRSLSPPAQEPTRSGGGEGDREMLDAIDELRL